MVTVCKYPGAGEAETEYMGGACVCWPARLVKLQATNAGKDSLSLSQTSNVEGIERWLDG